MQIAVMGLVEESQTISVSGVMATPGRDSPMQMFETTSVPIEMQAWQPICNTWVIPRSMSATVRRKLFEDACTDGILRLLYLPGDSCVLNFFVSREKESLAKDDR